MSGRKREPMILPEPGDQSVTGFWRDDRLPDPFVWGDDGDRLAAWRWGEGVCERGRHLFDVVEVARDIEDEDEDETTTVEFRARLTCVTCGYIAAWEGVRHRDQSLRVDPIPLSAGNYRAQQVSDRGHGLTSYAVYDGESSAVAGVITWARGPRGRTYFRGRLGLATHPDGWTAEGPTPAAVLRKLAKAGQATPSQGGGAA
jgi:hypothetical protein